MTIKDNLKRYRKLRGYTLEELGKKIGTSKQTIARYENGEIVNIPYDKIMALAKALDVFPQDLMGWSKQTPDYIANYHDTEILIERVQKLDRNQIDMLNAYLDLLERN